MGFEAENGKSGQAAKDRRGVPLADIAAIAYAASEQ
jgi:hypothetical protein